MTSDQKQSQDGGSGDSPLESLLREALAARAEQIGVHDLRPAAPPSRRIRRLKPVYAAVLPLGLAAAVAVGFLGFRANTVADRVKPAPAASMTASRSAEPTTSPSSSPSASPSASVSDSASADATQTGSPVADTASAAATGDTVPPLSATLGAVQSYRGVKFQLPTGWTAGAASGDRICLQAPGHAGSQCGPSGVMLAVYSTAHEVNNTYYPTTGSLDNQSNGWTDSQYCYSTTPHPGTAMVSSFNQTTVPLAGSQATLSTWQLGCAMPGENFTARMWGFRKEQVFIVADGLGAQYEPGLQAFLGSLDLSGHLSPTQGDPVSISTGGFGQGQAVPDDNSKVPFTVTFTNTSAGQMAQVVPEVYVALPPTGTLEQQLDDGSWVSMPIGLTTTYPAPPQNVPAFALAPGASKTVTYRISLAPVANFAQIKYVLSETAWMRFTDPQGSTTVLGTATPALPTVAK